MIQERDILGGLGEYGRAILQGTLKNRYQYEGLGWSGSEQGLLESPCECGFEPPGFITNGVI